MPTISHTTDIDFECYCDACGGHLNSSVARNGDVQVGPCANCVSEATDQGFERAREQFERAD